MEKHELLHKLSETEFAALDLQLYLDTHPCDAEAIEKYNCAVSDGDKLRKEYTERYGRLFSFIEESNPERFDWIDNPWPWDKGFNSGGMEE